MSGRSLIPTIDAADLTGDISLSQLGELLDSNNDIEADHQAAANLPDHASRHEDGGADEIDAGDLAGGNGADGEVIESDGSALSYVEPDGRYNPATHASTHQDGGSDELDAAGLAGGDGTNGQVLQTDGAAASWVQLTGSDVDTQLDTGTVTASGGSTPAVDTTLANVGISETDPHDLVVYVDADPAFNADYAFNYEWGFQWDQSQGQVDINLTVNWDTDPGGGNDVTLRWELVEP